VLDVLGLDIGGANLKAATACGVACTVPFALWRHPDGLADALRVLLLSLPGCSRLAVTMTGELCDCFASKRAGVLAIMDAVSRAAEGRLFSVWLTDGRLVEQEIAREKPDQAAASNWLALSTFAGRLAPVGPALLLDTGSTTSDIIPLLDGRPVPQGRNDRARLQSGELVYTGACRTPVCALLGGDGAAEFFATMADVYLLLGEAPENTDDRDTADGRPLTRVYAQARLARMLCADLDSITEAELLELARSVAQRQETLLARAIGSVVARQPQPPRTVIFAGSGSFVAQRAWRRFAQRLPCRLVDLGQELGPDLSTAACAYALAVLARERMVGGQADGAGAVCGQTGR